MLGRLFAHGRTKKVEPAEVCRPDDSHGPTSKYKSPPDDVLDIPACIPQERPPLLDHRLDPSRDEESWDFVGTMRRGRLVKEPSASFSRYFLKTSISMRIGG